MSYKRTLATVLIRLKSGTVTGKNSKFRKIMMAWISVYISQSLSTKGNHIYLQENRKFIQDKPPMQ